MTKRYKLNRKTNSLLTVPAVSSRSLPHQTTHPPRNHQPSLKFLALFTAGVVGGIAAPSACSAKVADCPPIVRGGVEYTSHRNYVQAVKQSTGEVLWRTVLFTEKYTREFDPRMEEDVQWNMACIEKVRATEVVVSDHKGRVFRVSRASGELISTKESSK